MARSIGSRLPDELQALLDGSALEQHVGVTLELLSTTADNWPHLAMLSVGEVLAPDASHVRLALWPRASAVANLERVGRATLALVYQGRGYSIRLQVQRAADLDTPLSGRLARFGGEVQDVLKDVAPYAVLETGTRFRLNDEPGTLTRWRQVIAALRA
jgi:hypothetical protein